MIFLGREIERHGRFLTGQVVSVDEAIIRTGTNWLPNFSIDQEAAVRLTDADIARESGMPEETFRSLIENSLHQWRESPSRSPISILQRVGSHERTPLFETLLDQTRALVSLSQSGILNLNRGGPIRAVLNPDKTRVMAAAGTPAMTLADDGYEALGRAITALRLWQQRNKAKVALGQVKLPKALYRGIRMRDIDVQRQSVPGEAYPVRRSRDVLAANDMLVSQPLASISHSSILSFTATRTIAEYFANNEGFVVEIDPAEVDVVCAWATDELLAEADPMTGRQEREWIVRIPPTFIIDQAQVHNRDYVFHRSFGSPLAVGMIEHNDVADYTIDGHEVRAAFVYRSSGVGGAIRYTSGLHYSLSRQAMKKALGVDPLPSAERPPSKLVYRNRDPYLPRSNKDYPVLTEEDLALPEMDAMSALAP